MPITINGTTVTTNSINGTSISKETVNGTQVYGGILTKQWVLIYIDSSEPSVDWGLLESSSNTSYWLAELTLWSDPNNHAVGVTACVWNDSPIYYVYQVQEV